MFDPTRRLLDEIAAAIDKSAPRKLLEADELMRWATREYDRGYLLVEDDGRRLPLSPEQILSGARLTARKRAR